MPGARESVPTPMSFLPSPKYSRLIAISPFSSSVEAKEEGVEGGLGLGGRGKGRGKKEEGVGGREGGEGEKGGEGEGGKGGEEGEGEVGEGGEGSRGGGLALFFAIAAVTPPLGLMTTLPFCPNSK